MLCCMCRDYVWCVPNNWFVSFDDCMNEPKPDHILEWRNSYGARQRIATETDSQSTNRTSDRCADGIWERTDGQDFLLQLSIRLMTIEELFVRTPHHQKKKTKTKEKRQMVFLRLPKKRKRKIKFSIWVAQKQNYQPKSRALPTQASEPLELSETVAWYILVFSCFSFWQQML